MRKFFGIVLIVLGVPILLAGAAAAVFVGPDDTATLVDKQVNADEPVVATSSSLLEVTGATLHVTSDGGSTETFVGVAHPLHVDAYLTDVPFLEIAQVSAGGDMTTASRDGGAEAPAKAPADLDWWAQSSFGSGEQSIDFALTEEPVRLVVMNSDMSAPVDVNLKVGGEIEGLFITVLLVAVVGLVFIAGGIVLLRANRNRKGEMQGEGTDSESLADAAGSPSAAASNEPMRRTVDGRRNRRSLAVGVIGVGAVVLAGCAEIPQQVSRTSDEETIPSATSAQVEEFFVNYTKTNNSANKKFNAEKLGDVETGALLRESVFGYEEAKAQKLDPAEPFDMTASTTIVPEVDAYPLWYWASDEWDGDDKGSNHYLVTRESPTEPWRAALSLGVSADVTTPVPTVEDGVATVAPGGAKEAEKAFSKLVKYAEGGKKPKGVNVKGAAGFGDIRKLGIDLGGNTDGVQRDDFSCEVDDPESMNWLETEDGSAAMGSLSCVHTLQLDAGYWFTMEDPFGTIPTDVQLNGATTSGSVAFMIEVKDDGSVMAIDDGGELTGTSYTEN